MSKFKSELVTRILGAGITEAQEVSRDDAKRVLSQAEDYISKRNWLWMVVKGFMGDECSWDIESLLRYLKEIEHDIRLIKLRLVETANPEITNNTKDEG